MASIPEPQAPVNPRVTLGTILDEAVQTLRQTIGARINTFLVGATDDAVGRPHYVRRKRLSERLHGQAQCHRCGSSRSRRFSRNGFRPRQPLVTMWGEVPIELPRVKCDCGGSVQVNCGAVLAPYQRLGADVDAQIQRWGGALLSLRQMRQEAEQLYLGPVALRTLSQRVHQLKMLDPHRDSQDMPPIVQVDALWATLMQPNGQVRVDRKGRKRPVVGRFKVPIMVAMGVWPEDDRCEILLWRLGESESAEEWVKFLEVLEAQGIRGQNGLKLIIHDGGQGLCSALETVWFDAEQQRCLFHKLRNIWSAIRAPEKLTAKQSRRHRKKVFNEFRDIWEARRYDTMLRRYLKVVRTYRETQPEAVATLRRDFRLTVTYYRLEQDFPTWERRHLRTTSRLERFNRRLRRRTRAAAAYHSETGLSAMMAQEIRAFHDAQHTE